jgi:nucleoside-diphosphate-sugar epimerase
MDRARVLVTGGCGYIGSLVVEELLAAGHEVRVLDVLLHGQDDVARTVEAAGATLVRGDVRDADARAEALAGADAVVHLAAIVGDPACARDPKLAADVNVGATDSLLRDSKAANVARFVFASTCSNYGRMEDPTVPIAEDGTLAPVSLYAEQKVAMEHAVRAANENGLQTTCLRFATVYGVSQRMRFDLTVNEFTRDLWADRELEVFGEQFWRPYIHVRDAARAVRQVLAAPSDVVAGEVFNAGRSGENYRKLDLVNEVRRRVSTGTTVFVRRDEDPRDYKVSFDKIHERLGFETAATVPDGIAELVDALERNAFGDPFDARYRNIP